MVSLAHSANVPNEREVCSILLLPMHTCQSHATTVPKLSASLIHNLEKSEIKPGFSKTLEAGNCTEISYRKPNVLLVEDQATAIEEFDIFASKVSSIMISMSHSVLQNIWVEMVGTANLRFNCFSGWSRFFMVHVSISLHFRGKIIPTRMYAWDSVQCA